MKHIAINTFLIMAQMLLAIIVYGQSLTCNSVYQAEIQANGLTTIVPSDVLEGGSNPTSDLTLSISTSNGNVIAGPSTSVDVSCYPGSTLTYQVTHGPSGNSCWGNVEIVDPNGYCISGSLLADEVPIMFSATSLSGPFMQAVYLNGQPLRQYDANAFALNTTDLATGINILSFDGVRNSVNGVTTLDQVLIQRHLTDVEDLSAIASIRADVDRSEFLGSDDLVEIRRIILGQVNNTTEYFALNIADIPADFDEYDFPGLYDYTFDASSITTAGLTFEVHQPGDVNFSSNLQDDDQSTDSRSVTLLTYQDKTVYAGETIKVPVSLSIEQSIAGLQFSFAQSDEYQITNIASDYSFAEFDQHVTDAEARLSYIASEDVQTFNALLTIEVLADGLLSDHLRASETFTQELVTGTLTARSIALEPTSPVSVSQDIINHVEINPTVLDAYSIVTIPEQINEATLTIYDAVGRIVVSHTVNNQHHIYRSQLLGPGVYIAQIQYAGQSTTTRLLAK